MSDIKIKEKLNLYICEHNCHNVTVDVDKGVTPFMIGCMRRSSPGRPLNPLKSKDGVCIGTAKSSFYPKTIDSKFDYPVATHEWYRPDLLEYSKLSDSEKDHVKNGGLLLRGRTEKKAILQGEDCGYDTFDIPDYEAAL